MFEQLQAHIKQSPRFLQLISSVSSGDRRSPISIGGVAGSLLGFLLSAISNSLNRQLLVIVPERAQASVLSDDLSLLHGDTVRLFDFGPERPGQLPQSSPTPEAVATLRSLLESEVDVVITPAASLPVPLPTPSTLRSNSMKLEVNSERVLTDLVSQLNAAGFERADFVGTPGEYSQRGGILDVFSHAGEYPIRLEFLGDTIESIREFDPLSQRSIRAISVATITPNLFHANLLQTDDTKNSSIFHYLNPDAIVFLIEPEIIWRQLEGIRAAGTELPIDALREQIGLRTQLHLESFSSGDNLLDFGSSHQQSFNGNIPLLRKHLLELLRNDMRVVIACDGQAELNRLRELITEPAVMADSALSAQRSISENDIIDLRKVEFVHHAIQSGFLLPDTKIACYTEHQIFGRLKRRGKGHKARIHGFSPKELQQLRRGDFVVHEDFGIGRFEGLKKIRVRDVEQEVMKLSYEENDALYINLNFLGKVKKYSSKDGLVPKLTRLGTQEWDRLKERAKKRIQDIARDLIQLYAQRKSSIGYNFQPDTSWQKELEASFIYEDTFDQAKATLDVKRDMEQPFPMDRLVCGDVGFGKTEVAVRAAFKAVLGGKQAAVLVPTTILAIQHFNTFVDRTSRFSVRVAVISRLKSKREQAQILEQLQSGAIDIIIGTHRLLSKDVHFKDLGLLVIDEEHRFGVSAKEKLRQLRATVDTLILTATPIPRTLHFSLLGARDLSIIATPPRNRLPIVTEIAQYNEELIKEAITREANRGGQVYFVHDKVHDIEAWTEKLRVLLPALRVHHAHGQMHAHELEQVMLDFQEKKLDVLVCTKIIESGLDIPNVNTIIINRADRFGMSELYQLKGRVGRSNVQAYAYLLAPPVSVMTRTTIQRLQAIEEFTELGSGLNLAMRDLEIRGAGNLLGAEQSGFIESMGFETYTRILDEAVAELKETEFKELFADREAKKRSPAETVVEIELDALVPDSYIQNDTERLEIYRRMYELSTQEQLMELGEELKDRFGPHPVQVRNLLNAVRVRLAAASFGFRKVAIGRSVVEIEFPAESDITFYEGSNFQNLMTEISRWKRRGVQLKQVDKLLKLSLRLQDDSPAADPISAALNFLQELYQGFKPTSQVSTELATE
ncbi:MAG: transcription-repair coupling factor [Bacteroidetes bacterium]|nr:transcription-repair coupling factor [Bacteroidota bacterium]